MSCETEPLPVRWSCGGSQQGFVYIQPESGPTLALFRIFVQLVAFAVCFSPLHCMEFISMPVKAVIMISIAKRHNMVLLIFL